MNQDAFGREQSRVFQTVPTSVGITAEVMTERSQESARLAYRVAMPEPETHLFEVTLTVSGWQQPTLDLHMPVWTPGSYLIREYARHVQDFSALAGDSPNTLLPWQKVSKNRWQIATQGIAHLIVRYRVYANELTVRTNHLDRTHGYFNGAALFFYIPGYERAPIEVAIAPPPGWRVTTALPSGPTPHSFLAADFDTLVDSPFEIGTHAVYEFEAAGKPHQLAVWGKGNLNADQLISDIQKIVQTEADLFGSLPYQRYLFLLHLTTNGYGGLEHQNSCSLLYERFGFRSRDKYTRFLQLVAHEFFHLWNIKRLRPKALEIFDYEQENYTPSLWFSEGTTSYYDLLIPLRAGLYDGRTYLTALSREVSRYLTTPGRWVQPLSESSFDAWIKLYRQDANSPNNQISYYLKGEMVSLLLDLLIRHQHQNQRSLDDVLRHLWHHYGKLGVGFSPQQLQQAIESVAASDLSEFFHRYLHTTEELPLVEHLSWFGLQLQPESDNLPFTGMVLKAEQGQTLVKFVETGGPAQRAGIDAGDEIVALNGFRVTAEQWSDRLSDFAVGDIIQVSYFHQNELRHGPILLAEPRPKHYQIVPVKEPSQQQAQNLLGWLGVPLTAL